MNTGYLGDTTPKLGFGLMRLPMIGDEIDMEQTKAMVDTFMAKGFTYFDTAYVYINGKSETTAVIIERTSKALRTLLFFNDTNESNKMTTVHMAVISGGKFA